MLKHFPFCQLRTDFITTDVSARYYLISVKTVDKNFNKYNNINKIFLKSFEESLFSHFFLPTKSCSQKDPQLTMHENFFCAKL